MASYLNQIGIKALEKQMNISLRSGYTLILDGQPGTGKTQVVRQFARNFLASVYNVDPDTHYLYKLAASKTTEYTGGIMMPDGNGGCDQMIPGWIRSIPEHAIIHIDELDKLPLREQMPYLQLIHERGVDGYTLPKTVHFIVTANRSTDRGGSLGINKLLGNRARVYSFLPDPNEVLEYMVSHGFHYMITAYLRENPNKINNYKDVAGELRNETSRSWEMASDALKILGEPATDADIIQTIAGSVPDTTAQEFQLYAELRGRLVPAIEVLENPRTAKVPAASNRGLAWLQVSMVAAYAAAMKASDKLTIPGKGKEPAKVLSRGQCMYAAFVYARRFAPEYMMAVFPIITAHAVDSTYQGATIPAEAWKENGGEDAREMMKILNERKAILERV